MHRVELKALSTRRGWGREERVPNAPCGVESGGVETLHHIVPPPPVPNAPCGVERIDLVNACSLVHFVPNAPCGVESWHA